MNIVISGPSGAGKTTVIAELIKDPNFIRVVTATTRSPRPGEKDLLDYLFISKEDFEAGIEKNNFLEYAIVFNKHYYGTPRSSIGDDGKHYILNLDVQGAQQLKNMGFKAIYVFLKVNEDVLRDRLTKRGTETVIDIEHRIKISKKELQKAHFFDVIIENTNVANTISIIKKCL